jgi:hypothetical protein
MVRARRGTFVAWLLAAAIPLLAAARCADAQRIADLPQPPATTTNPPAALVLTASAASLDAVSSITKDMGPGADVPLLTADFIEQRLPFIGPGGLAHDRPLGVLFYLASDLDLERALTFVLPVNPGKAELKTFTDKGGSFVAGRTDLVSLEGVGFRRTKDQFIFGQTAGAVAAVREDVLTSAYAGSPGVLARVDFDAAALRKTIPDRYDAFLADIDSNIDTTDPAARAGVELVTRALRAVTRLGVSVARTANDGGVRLALRVEPFAPPKKLAATPATLTRPGFPDGTTILRADLASSPAESLVNVTDAIKTTVERDAQFAKLSPQQQERARALASGFAAFLLAGESGSLAVESTNGQTVGHWVTQRSGAPIDVERDMRALAQQAAELARSTKDVKPAMSYESYATRPSGTKVHRLVLPQDGKPSLYVDAIARDSTVFMSVAQSPGKFVERLLSLQHAGETATLASGWLDLDAFSALGIVPAVQGAVDVKGQRLAWTATAEQGTLRIDIDIPKSLLQHVPKLVQQLQ